MRYISKLRYVQLLSRYLVPWPLPTKRSREWKASRAIKVYVAAWLVVLGWKAGLDGLGVNVRIGVAVLITDMVLLTTIWLARGADIFTARDLGLCRVPSVRAVGYVLMAVMTLVLFDRLFRSILPPASSSQFKGVASQSVPNVILAGFVACFSAPVIEELFFRGFIYRSLRNQLPVFTAALIAGIMFGAMHIDSFPLAALPSKAFFGIVACLLYERLGSVLPGILLHSLIDSGSFALAVSGTDRLVLITAGVIAACLLLGPVIRGCWRFVNGKPILKEYGPTRELMVI